MCVCVCISAILSLFLVLSFSLSHASKKIYVIVGDSVRSTAYSTTEKRESYTVRERGARDTRASDWRTTLAHREPASSLSLSCFAPALSPSRSLTHSLARAGFARVYVHIYTYIYIYLIYYVYIYIYIYVCTRVFCSRVSPPHARSWKFLRFRFLPAARTHTLYSLAPFSSPRVHNPCMESEPAMQMPPFASPIYTYMHSPPPSLSNSVIVARVNLMERAGVERVGRRLVFARLSPPVYIVSTYTCDAGVRTL